MPFSLLSRSRIAQALRASHANQARKSSKPRSNYLAFEPLEDRQLLSINPVANASGQIVETLINGGTGGFTTGAQENAAVAIRPWTTANTASGVAPLASTEGVVVFQSQGQDNSGYAIMAQRFNPNAAATANPLVGGNVRINTMLPADQLNPAVAIRGGNGTTNGAGNVVIAWNSVTTADPDGGIQLRRFSNTLGALGGTAEFLVNTTVAGVQSNPSIAINNDPAAANGGSFIVVWESTNQDGSGKSVHARYFGSTISGAAAPSEIQVNQTTDGDQFNAVVAVDGDGDFVVVWETDTPTEGRNIVGRWFSSAPNFPAGGAEFVIAGGAGNQTNPAISMGPDGDFVVAWQGEGTGDADGIFAREYTSQRGPGNVPVADPAGAFLVNTTTLGAQTRPSVAVHVVPDTAVTGNNSRGFVIAWQGAEGAGLGEASYARGYTSAGQPRGDEVKIHSNPRSANQSAPVVAMDALGQGMIAFASQSAPPGQTGDTDGYGVYAVRYSKLNATPVVTDITVNVPEDASAFNIDLTQPGIVTDADGDTITFSNISATGLTAPQNGLLQPNTTVPPGTFGSGRLLYTPNVDFVGVDRFTYTVSDGTVTSAVAVVEINVTQVNDAPTISTSGPVVSVNTATNPVTITTASPHNLSNGQRIFVSGLMAFRPLTSAVADTLTGQIRFTSTAHGLATGDRITVANSLGTGAFDPNTGSVNGSWLVTVINANEFMLRGSTFSGAYTGNSGRLERLSAANGYRTIQGAAAGSSTFQLVGVTSAIFGGTHVNDRKGTLVEANPGPGNTIEFTSPNHGLINGAQITITGATGTGGFPNLGIAQTFRVFVLDANRFRLLNTNFGPVGADYTNNSGQFVVPTGEWEVAPLNGVLSNATNTAVGQPIVITTVGSHGLSAGQIVTISGVQGNENANGTFRVAASPAPGASTFALLDLQGVPVSGSGAYNGGGQWRAVDSTKITNVTGATTPLTITANGHGLATGDTVTISDVLVGGNISGVTDVGQNQPSVVTTAAAHGLTTGQRITISDVWRGANVSAATNETPIRITTSTAHRLNSGDHVVIAGVAGNTAANNSPTNPEWTIQLVPGTTNQFDLFFPDGSASVGNGAASGGNYRSRSTLNSETPGDRVVRVISTTQFEVQEYRDEAFPNNTNGIAASNGVIRINTPASDIDADAGQGQVTLSGVMVGGQLTNNTGSSASAGFRFTSAAHNLQTGDKIRIAGVTGSGPYASAINGDWIVTRTSADVITLQGAPAFSGTYNAGSGKWIKLDASDALISANANGTFRTDGVDINQFDLVGSTFAGPYLYFGPDLALFGLPAAKWTGVSMVQLNEGGTGQGAVLSGIANHPTTANWTAPSAANGTWQVTVTGANTFTIPATSNGTFRQNLNPTTGEIVGDFSRRVTQTYPHGIGQTNLTLAGLSGGPVNELGQGLTVTASSDNPQLIPNPTVFYPDADPTRLRVTLVPDDDFAGTANITININDGAITRQEVMTVAINNPPELNSFTGPAIQVLEDSVNNFIQLTGITEGHPTESGQTLRLRAIALDPVTNLPSQARITDPWISYAEGSSTAFLSFNTVGNAVGPVRIRVFVEDDSGAPASSSSTFRDIDVTIIGVADTPFIQDVITNINTQSSQIFITNNGADTTAFKVQNIFGGTLALNNGTLLTEGTWITTAQAAPGLRFTPFTNSIVAGTFELLPSTNSAIGTQDLGVSPGIAPAVGHVYISQPQGTGAAVGTTVNGAGGNYQASATATDAKGNYVVTYVGQNDQGTQAQLFFRRYDANGVAQGAPVLLDSDATANFNFDPAIAMDPDGDFVVVWADQTANAGLTGSGADVVGRRFDAQGIAKGGFFRANTFTAQQQFDPAVAMDSQGNFVVTWTSFNQSGTGINDDNTDSTNGVYAQRFDFNNDPIGREVRVNSAGASGLPTGAQQRSSVSMDPEGNFIVAWESQGQGAGAPSIADNESYSIRAQRYDKAGNRVGIRELQLITVGGTQPAGSGVFDLHLGNKSTRVTLTLPANAANFAANTAAFQAAMYVLAPGATVNQDVRRASNGTTQFVVTLPDGGGVDHGAFNSATAALLDWPQMTTVVAGGHFTVAVATDATNQGAPTNNNTVLTGTQYPTDEVQRITFTNAPGANEGASLLITVPGLGTPLQVIYSNNQELTLQRIQAALDSVAPGDFVVSRHVGDITNLQAVVGPTVQITSPLHGLAAPVASPFPDRVKISGVLVGANLTATGLANTRNAAVVITSNGHGFSNGQKLTLSGVRIGGQIANATPSSVANGIRFTQNGHGLETGDQVTLAGVAGSGSFTNLNGTYTVTKIDNNVFQLQGVPFVSGTYAANSGWWSKSADHLNGTFYAGNVTANTFQIYEDPGLTQLVLGTGGIKMSTSGRWDRESTINGTWRIGLIDAHNFTIFNPVTNVGANGFGGTWTAGTGSWELVSNGAQPTPATKWSIDIGFTGKLGTRDVPSLTVTGAGASRTTGADRQGTNSEFRVNTTVAGAQRNPSVALSPSGDFMIAFEHHVTANTNVDVYARLFNVAGVVTNTTPTNNNRNDFRVNVTTNGNQSGPKVLGMQDGTYIVTWHDQPDPNQLAARVVARPYNAVGRAGNVVEMIPFDAFDPDNNTTTPAPFGASVDYAGRVNTSIIQFNGAVSSVFTRSVSLDLPSTVPLFNSSGAISGTSATTPTQITAVNHGLSSGQIVSISGVLGNTIANGLWQITVIDEDTFSIPTPPNGPYGGGGQWTIVPVNSGTPIEIISPDHGLQTGDQVVVAGVRVGAQIANASGIGPGDIIITSPGHGLTSNDTITVSGVQGNTNANGTNRVVTVIDANTFRLNNTSLGNGAYVPGTGQWTLNQSIANANGRWIVTRINENRFSLNGTVGNGPYIGGAYTTAVSDLIDDVTNGGPIVVTTTTPHGLSIGDTVIITNVAGNVAANGTHTVVPLSAPIANVTDNIVSTVNPLPPIVVTSPDHRLTNGQQIAISGVDGNTNTNGTFTVGPATGWITTLTNATPPVLTSNDHGLRNGEIITISGVQVGAAISASASNTVNNDVHFTSNGHNLQTGDSVTIAGVAGSGIFGGGALNGTFTVTRVDANIFTLDNTPFTSGTYTAGSGVWIKVGAAANPNGVRRVSNSAANAFNLLDPNNFDAPVVANGPYLVNAADLAKLGLPPAAWVFGRSGSVSAATNAAGAPVRVTNGSVNHLLSDGAEVLISNVGGNTAANGTRFVKVASATEFDLYFDRDLTQPVIGNGAFTTGGTWQQRDLGLDSFSLVGATGNGNYTPGTGSWAATTLGPRSFALAGTVGNGAYVAGTGRWTVPFEKTPPVAAGVYVGRDLSGLSPEFREDLQPVLDGEKLQSGVEKLVVSFSERLTTDFPDASVTNVANWQLLRNQVIGGPSDLDVTTLIQGITFGINPVTNRYEAVLTFTVPLPQGDYLLRATDAITDIAGNDLDGDQNGVAGGDFEWRFSTLGTQAAGPEQSANVFQFNDQSNSSVARDANGNYVVVWQTSTHTAEPGSSSIWGRRYLADGTPLGANEVQRLQFTGTPSNNFSQFDLQLGSNPPVRITYTTTLATLVGRIRNALDSFDAPVNVTGVLVGGLPQITITFTGLGLDRPTIAATPVPGGAIFGITATTVTEGGANSEFKISGTPAANLQGNRVNPKVSMADDGRFVVVWEAPDGSGSGIYMRRFGANGAPIGNEVLVNAAPEVQNQPSVDMAPDGTFVVVWRTNLLDGSEGGIRMRRYSAAGAAQGAEIAVNNLTLGDQSNPDVVVGDEGTIMVVWQSPESKVSLSATAWDQTTGGNIRVVAPSHGLPAPDPANGGRVFIQISGASWNGLGTDPNGIHEVVALGQGTAAANEFFLEFNGDTQSTVSGGEFTLLLGNDPSNLQPSGQGVFGRRYDRNGALLATGSNNLQFRINTTAIGDQTNPVVEADDGGRFVVAWNSPDGTGNGVGIVSQIFRPDAAGSPGGLKVGTLNEIQRLQFNNASPPPNARFRITYNGVATSEITFSSTDAELTATRIEEAMAAIGVAVSVAPGTNPAPQRDFFITFLNEGENVPTITVAMTNGAGTPATSVVREGGTGLGGYEIPVNTTLSGDQANQQIAMDSDGDMVITWTSGGEIIARRFNVLGGAQGNEFTVNTPTAGAETSPSVAVDPDGNMVVTWTGQLLGADYGQEVAIRRFLGNTLPPVLPTGDPGGPYTVDEGGTVELTATATAGLTYTWDLDGDGQFGETGAGALRGDETGLTPTYDAGGTNRPNGPGIQTVMFRVDDGIGGVLTLPVDITINNVAPTAPTIDPGPGANGSYSVNEGGTVTLTVSGSTDLGPDAIAYEWDLDGDGQFGETGASATRGNEVGTSVSFIAAGLDGETGAVLAPAVSVRANDGNALSGVVTMTAPIVINVQNVQPTPNAGGPYTVNEGGTVNLTGSALDPAGALDTATFSWDLDGDGLFGAADPNPQRGSEVGPNVTFSAAGLDGATGAVFNVKLRVDDGEGGALMPDASINISIGNLPPVVNAGGPYIVIENGTTTLDGASFSDPGGAADTLTLEWDLDNDGIFGETGAAAARGNETGAAPTFNANGLTVGMAAPVSFRATDDSGASATASGTVNVQAIGGGPSQILDDEDAGYGNTPLPAWTETVDAAAQQGDLYSTIDSAGEATWTFSVPSTGLYLVQATWISSASLTTNAPYEILDGSVSRGTVLKDQTLAPNDLLGNNGSDWENLAFVNVADGGSLSLTVRLTSPADGRRFIADAIRIERIGNLPASAEIQVTESGSNVTDNSGTVDFGIVSVGGPVVKTFEISNSGQGPLSLGAVTVPTGFTLVAPPAVTTLNSGESTTFQLQMDAAAVGNFTGQVSFASTGDSDEDPFNFQVTGAVASFQIIDDTLNPPANANDPGFRKLGDPEAWGYQTGIGREGDFHYPLAGDSAQSATWTFDVTPGLYRVSVTWANGLPPTFASNASFTVFDSISPRGTTLVNQRISPAGFTDQGSTWEDLGTSYSIAGNRLVVKLDGAGADGDIFVDAIRIERIGDLPAVPEISVSLGEVDIADDSGVVDFGTTHVGTPVIMTFTVSNSGGADLNLDVAELAQSIPSGFTLLQPPAATVVSGGVTTFVVQLDATVHNNGIIPFSGVISLGTDDADEDPFNFAIFGRVVEAQIIDNGDSGYVATTDFSGNVGAMHLDDYDTAAADDALPTALATWTFTVAPGQYRVMSTWTGFLFWTSSAPYTVWDGDAATGTNLGTFTENQKLAPNDLTGIDGADWEYLGGIFDITGTTLTVTLAVGPDGTTVADAIRIQRIDGGGNSEDNAESGLGLSMASSSSGGTLRGGPEASDLDDALATAYWNDELDDVAAVLASDAGLESDLSDDLASSTARETEALDLALAGWLD